MTAVLERPVSALAIPLDPSLEAHEPPEARGIGRGDVRLLVSHGDTDVAHATFADLAAHLRAGDALVVNTSATIPAAIDGGRARRRSRCASTSPPSCPAGSGWSRPRLPGRQHDGSVRRRPRRHRRRARGRRSPAPARPLRRLAAAVARGAARAPDRARPPRAPRRADPLPARARRLAARRVPADLRHRAGQRGDAERGAAVHARARRRPRAPRRHDHADPVARGRVVARSARDAVPRALPRARRPRPRTSTRCTPRAGA